MKQLIPHLHYGWPALLLLGVEATIFTWVVQYDGQLPPMSAISISAALITLLIGTVALILRPSQTTQVGTAMTVVLSAFILVPVRPGMVAEPLSTTLFAGMPAHVLWRLGNGALFAPLIYQLSAHFPLQATPTACPQPSRYTISRAYLIMGGIVLAFLALPTSRWRLLLFAAILIWTYALVGRAIWRLACISRDPTTENAQARQQARVLLVSALLAAIPSILLNGTELLAGHALVRADFAALFLVLLPLGMAYTILRHDLLQVDGAIRRGLAYTALSALVLALYFVLTLLLTVGIAQRQPELLRLIGALSVLLATFAFAPLQVRIQQLVDRWLYPERRAFFHAVAAARQNLGAVVERSTVVTLLTETLPDQISAQWASLALVPAPLIPEPQATAPGWQGILHIGDTILGRYWLGPRSTLTGYEADEADALRQLLQEAALVLAYDETISALRTLNLELEKRVAERTAQVVTQQRALAAHEQRQQLARDLHDSVTQSLFSLNLSLRAIRKLGERDATAAVAELAAQEAAAQQALGEMRALLTQLRSDVTDAQVMKDGETTEGELGRQTDLMARLQRLATSYTERQQLWITVEGPETMVVPTWVTEELIYLTREALHNVYKHSGQQQATVTITCKAEQLTLTITDEGRGFDWSPATENATEQSHYGLQGMQERACHLGGTLAIHSAPGQGTELIIRVPHADSTEHIAIEQGDWKRSSDNFEATR